jgi:hypothetical protein
MTTPTQLLLRIVQRNVAPDVVTVQYNTSVRESSLLQRLLGALGARVVLQNFKLNCLFHHHIYQGIIGFFKIFVLLNVTVTKALK